MKLNCLHADTCLPDYWGGHHLAHISVPVHRGMTPAALRAVLRDELRMGAVCGSDDIAEALGDYSDIPDDKRKKVYRAAHAAINRDVRPAKKGTRRLFLDLDPAQDDAEETAYAYFVFSESTD